MIDAVLSYHLNPFTCGVAKFNQQLAQRLGVPIMGLGSDSRYPLVSVKPSEIPGMTRMFGRCSSYDLLLHDRTVSPDSAFIKTARRVFYADELGCPSTLEGNPTRSSTNVLLFGMAHKIDTHTVYVERLRDLLQRQGDYTVSVSTAVHEGSPWDGAFTTTVDRLRKVFGENLRVLGYLADDALAKELHDCTAVALFFDPAVRANNTTLWAALEAGAPVITNLDDFSPAELTHNINVFDLKQMTDWPFLHLRSYVGWNGKETARGRSWEKLIEVLRA